VSVEVNDSNFWTYKLENTKFGLGIIERSHVSGTGTGF